MAESQRDERQELEGQPSRPQDNGDNGRPDADASQPAARRATKSRRPTPRSDPQEAALETPPPAGPQRPVRRRARASAPAQEAEPAGEGLEEGPRRRRTRRTTAAEPVASSDNMLPQEEPDAEVEEAPADPATRPEVDAAQNGRERKRKREKRKKKKAGSDPNASAHPGQPFVGMLEMIGDKNFGFIRQLHTSLPKGDNDPFMPPPLIEKWNIRDGAILEGIIKPGRKGAWQVTEVTKIMGVDPEAWKEFPDFDHGVTIYPTEKLNLVAGPTDISMRVIDLVAPLGKGQRALIVAPPRAGKTIILKQMARSIAQNHPEVELIALLIDERPEEVTDFKRTTAARVFASSNDFQEDNHIRVATLAFEYCRRLVEMGKDVVLLLDSLTRLGRTFNLWAGNSGRTMSGGLDARALLMPRKIFGAARNIENAGSLTIVATALIETGSRMDDVIFEEFKGTGNAEIVLDRELADKRIYPAINLRKSGTRNVERILGEEMTHYHNMLMRALNSRHPVEGMQALLRHVMTSPDNVHLMNELIPSEI